MKISHRFTTIPVIILLSFITLGAAASALTRPGVVGQSKSLLSVLPQLRWLFTSNTFSSFFSTTSTAPALQAVGVTPLEIEYSVEQISLTLISQDKNTAPAPQTFRPQAGKISITGNETVRQFLGNFSTFASSGDNGRTVQRLVARVTFPGLPAATPIIVTADFTQGAEPFFGGFYSTSVSSISPNKINTPQTGEIEIDSDSFSQSLRLSFKWKNGSNGCAFPTVSEPPKSVTVCESSPASFSVAATGNGTLRYQWRRNGLAIPGATNPTLTFAAVSASDIGTYEALVADDCGPVRSATAFLGVNRPGEYSVLDRLTASDAMMSGNLGRVIARSGNTLITTGRSVNGYAKVYVFAKSGEKWAQEAILKPVDTTNDGFFSLDERVVIDNNTIALADSSNVYIFVRNGSIWTQQTKIASGNNSGSIKSITLQGDTLVIGQPDTSSGQLTSVGRVQIYQRTGQTWNLQSTLNPTDVESYLYFVDNIALSGNSLVVVATNRGLIQRQVINGFPTFVTIKEAGIGSAYVFERSGTTWGLKNKLVGTQKGDRFGRRVAINDNLLAVSSEEQITTGQYGALYLYQNLGSGWTEQQKLNINVPPPSFFFDPSILSISSTKLLANTSLFTRTAQGVDPTPRVLNFPEFGASSGVLAGETAIFGALNYNAGVNLESAGAVFVTSLVACGANLAVITSHPQNQQVADQLPAGFRIAFEKSSAITGLQWQVSTDGGNTYTDIAGATRAELSIAPDSPLYKNNNRFRVIIISTGGRITSDAATLTISATLSGFTTTSSSGLPVAVNLGSNTSVVFNNVTQSGTTTVKAIPLSGVTLPGGATPPSGSLAFDVTTTATFTGSITLTFNVPTVNDPAAFAKLRVYHGEGTPVQFVDRTVLPPDSPAPNYVQRQVSAKVTSLSPFVIAPASESDCGSFSVLPPNPQSPEIAQSMGINRTVKTDLNNDGISDYLGINGRQQGPFSAITGITDLTILLGDGSGNLAPPTTLVNAVPTLNAQSAEVADFNGDGNKDVLLFGNIIDSARGQLESYVRCFIPGDGKGGLLLNQRILSGDSSSGTSVGDFNGDGKLDLLNIQFGLALGGGNGAFSGYIPVSLPGTFWTVADFNKDGKAEVISDQNVYAYNEQGGFLFKNSLAGYPSFVLDFNNDGNIDYVSHVSDSVYFGDGTGAFSAGVSLGIDVIGNEVFEDVNGDKIPDIPNIANGKLQVYLGQKSGKMSAPIAVDLGGISPTRVLVGNWNADGKPDLLIAYTSNSSTRYAIAINNTTCGTSPTGNTGAGSNVVFTSNNTTVTFSNVTTAGNTTITPIAPTSAGALPNNYKLTDGSLAFEVTTTAVFSGPITITFNVPSVTDAAVFSTLRVLHSEGSPQALIDRTVLAPDTPAPSFAAKQISARVTSLSPFVIAGLVTTPPTGACDSYGLNTPVNYATGEAPGSLANADFNGDGRADLVTANYEAHTVSVLLNNGTGSFLPAVNYPVGLNPRFVTTTDLNSDQKADLVVTNLVGGSLSILLGNGDGTFRAAPNVTGMSYPSAVAVGDLNGDGKVDLIVANSGSYQTTAMFGNGDGTFTFGFEFFKHEGGMPAAVVMADFDKDGRLDFAVAYNNTNRAIVYFNRPGSYLDDARILDAGDQPLALIKGDFNADGYPDLAVANYASNDVTYLTNTKAANFTRTSSAVGRFPRSLSVTDFNGDKLDDLVVANDGTNFVTMLVSNQSGAPTRKDILANESPSAVTATDFNGDGKPDVIVADYWVNRITTYQGACASAFASESVASELKSLRYVRSKFADDPFTRNNRTRRGDTQRSR